ncbi:MAG: CZB domain-containing protein [Spirochaetes bacterium]|nr:CZB domain-containing protein [Spirochaetota bacterium]
MKFNDIGIRMKLGIGFGLVLFLLSMISVWSFVQMNNIKNSITRNQVKQDLRDLMKEKEINHLDWAAQVSKGILAGKSDAIEAQTDGHKCKLGEWYYSEARKRVEREMPELKTELAKMEEPHLALHREVINVKESLRNGEGGRQAANRIYNEEIITHLKNVRSSLTAISAKVMDEVVQSEKSIFASIRTGMVLVAGLFVLSLVIGVTVSMLISGSITRPVRLSLDFAGTMAEGDLTKRINLNQKDEIGQMVAALNRAAANLDEMFYNVSTGSQNLAQAIEQIATGNQTLSQRTAEQASSLEEIASTIEEATATINQNADNAVKAQELTEAGAGKSKDGNRVALEAVNSIIEMNASSKKIADIIAVINEIAFQTNLLALNAAVEAARAGEQGRGFAVVAGEVRNLAQRSGNAAKEIESLINDTVSKVGKSTELVKDTGGALNDIAEAATTTAQIISEIAAASMEQKQGIGQINSAISEMDSMTQQNAALVEETASSSEEMSNQAQEFLAMVQKFKITKRTVDVAGKPARQNHSAGAYEAAKKKDKGNGNGRIKAANPNALSNADGGSMTDILKQEGFEEF